MKQGTKVRPIDNYSESQLNQTTTAHETIALHSADTIAAAVAFRLSVAESPARLALKGKKCWDLQQAYKRWRSMDSTFSPFAQRHR